MEPLSLLTMLPEAASDHCIVNPQRVPVSANDASFWDLSNAVQLAKRPSTRWLKLVANGGPLHAATEWEFSVPGINEIAHD